MKAAQLLCVPLAIAVAAIRMQATANLVANGDFAQVADGKPAHWEAAGDPRSVEQSLTVIREGGRNCARLACTRIEGEGGAVHAMLAQVGMLHLEAGRLYEFRCRARQEGIRGRSVSVAISDMSIWENCGLEASLGVEHIWREYRIPFRATRTVDKTSRLQFWYLETGTLYISDVSITEIAAQKVEFTQVVPVTRSANLVPNGSFALGGSGWGTVGIRTGWGDLAHLHGHIVRSGEPGHPHFLRIPMGNGRTPMLGFDYYRPVMQLQLRALAANLRWIPLELGATYTLSVDVRSSVAGVRAALGYASLNPEDSAWNVQRGGETVSLTTGWKRYSILFTATRRYAFVMVGPDLAEDQAVEVDLDNVSLTKGASPASYVPHAALEVAVEATKPGGAFVVGETAYLVVRAANNDNRPRPVTVHLQPRDYYGRPASMQEVRLITPAGGVAERRVPMPSTWRGWYGITIAASSDRDDSLSVITPEIRVSIVPRSVGPTVLGLNHAFPDPWLIPIARLAGISEYRDWSLKWEHMEPQPGHYQWELADAQIQRVLDTGASVMALLPPFPSAEWSSTAPLSLRTSGYPGERLRQAWAPQDPALLAEFARRAVLHYKDRIRVWEFLNEPIYTDYSLPRSHYKPADYVELLRPVAAAIRNADPNAQIMGGAGAGPGGVTRELIAAGLLDLVDLLNLHIYPGSRAPEGYIAEMERLQSEMRRLRKVRPIWITEFSYYGADNLPRKPFMPQSGDWAEARLLDSEKQCADYTVRFCLIMLSHGCEKIFLHSGSCGSVNMPAFECCLFDYGGAPRKVASVLGQLSGLLGPHPRAVAVPPLPEGVYAAAFETGSASVAAVWATISEWKFRVPKGMRCADTVGRMLREPAIVLAESPIFLTAPSGQARSLVATIRGNVMKVQSNR